MQIKTPDQKLRVFISSTITELAEERKFAREVVNRLRLTPVLFELGARPHPPRNLYRAYLEQSDIFVGIYWNSYGWKGPGMEISGIEDEFDLSEGKPRLIYIREPAPERESLLAQLLKKIQSCDSVCYQKFSSSQELSELLANDLAILLSERFEAYPGKGTAGKKSVTNLPIIRTAIIGRENDLDSLKKMLEMPEVGLITITGPGGTGKTRLSLQLLHDIRDNYKDGVHFISLASITDATLVAGTIAQELGLFDAGKQPILNTLLEYLSDKKTVLGLDNFEQIIDAGFVVSKILERCQFVKIVVTSRTPLYLRGENLFSLSPLSNPAIGVPDSELEKYPAVQLFIQRAREINPRLVLDPKNLEAISAICQRLDGLPLAIELAAARTKFFPPVGLLSKMQKMLDLLCQGPKDLPVRQQTIRATIDWSINLLDDSQQRFFRRLSVFSDSWSLEASEVIGNWDEVDTDVQEKTEKLIDLGLVRSFTRETNNEEIEIRFGMLQVVKEYALEVLDKAGEMEKTKEIHADYFVEEANKLQSLTWLPDSASSDSWFDKEYENLRLAFSESLKKDNWKYCWQIIGSLPLYWIRHGRYTEAFEWMNQARLSPGKESDTTYTNMLDADFRARAYLAAGVLKYFAGNYKLSADYLEESARLYTTTANLKELGRAKGYLGLAKITLGDITGSDLTDAIQLGYKTHDAHSILVGSTFLSEALMAVGDYEKAAAVLNDAEKVAHEFGAKLGLANVYLQRGNLAFLLNQPTAEDHLLKSVHLFDDAGFSGLNGWCYINLGICLTEQKRFVEARQYLEKGLQNARERGERSMVLAALLIFGSLFFSLEAKAKAVKIFSAVETLNDQFNEANVWSTYKTIYEKSYNIIGTTLVDPQFANEVETGKNLTLEQLITLVMEKENEGIFV